MTPELRRTPAPLGDPTAWVLPHLTPARAIPLARALGPLRRLYPLPAPFHALWVPHTPPTAPPHPGALPQRQLHGCLWLPVDGEVWPAPTAEEVRSWLDGAEAGWWSPATGLVRLRADDCRAVSEFVTVERLDASDWTHARVPPPPPPPPVDEVLRQAAPEIATLDLDAPPPEPTPNTLWTRLKAWWSPPADQDPLQRLLRMLDEDPEEGLRYSIPIRDAPGRAPPARPPAGLRRHDLTLDLERPRASGGAGIVGSPNDVHRLGRHYRDAAQRAEADGRHRRAAFVWIHLLGDLRAGAQALERGGHWSDAAQVYRDRLNQPKDAARCFERGGRWLEAAELWEQANERARAARAYRHAGDEAAATRCFEEYVETVRGGDPVGAAEVLHTELQRTEEALALLARGWPDHPQAQRCARERRRLLEREGRHEDARRWVDTVALASSLEAGEELTLASEESAREEVRAAAADGVRRVAARALADAHPPASNRWAGLLLRLRPDDPWLRRDTARYAQQAQERRARQLRRPRGTLSVTRATPWPRHVEWHDACAVLGEDPVWLIGIGRDGDRVVALSQRLDRETPQLHVWRDVRPGPLRLVPVSGRRVWVGGPTLGEAWQVGGVRLEQPPGWVGLGREVAVAASGTGGVVRLERLESWVLSEHDAGEVPVGWSRSVARADRVGPPRLASERAGLWVGMGRWLEWWSGGRRTVRKKLAGSIDGLAMCPRSGLALVWGPKPCVVVRDSHQVTPLQTALNEPSGAFTGSGGLVLGDRLGAFEGYRVREGAQREATDQGSVGRIVAWVRDTDPGALWVVRSTGALERVVLTV